MYSLGATLFHILGGQPPFPGTEADQVVARRLVEPAPDVRQIRRDIHRDCAGAIACLLETDPHRRYSSYEQLIERLNEARRQAELAETVAQQVSVRQVEDTAETSTGQLFRSPLVIAACLLLLLVISGGIVGALVQTHGNELPPAPMTAPASLGQVAAPFVDPAAKGSDAKLEVRLNLLDAPTAAFVGRTLELRVQATAVGARSIIPVAPGTRLALVDPESGQELATASIRRLGQPVVLRVKTDQPGEMALRLEMVVPANHRDRVVIAPAPVARISWTRAPLPLSITAVEPSTINPVQGEAMTLRVTLGPNPLAIDLFDPSSTQLLLRLFDRDTGAELARKAVDQTAAPVELSIRPTTPGPANWAAVLSEAGSEPPLATLGRAIEGIRVMPARVASGEPLPIVQWDFDRGAANRGKLGPGASIVTDPERGRVLSLDGTKLGYLADTVPVPPEAITAAAWIKLAKDKPATFRISQTGQVITSRQLILTKWNDKAKRFGVEFAITGRNLTVNLGISAGRSNIAPAFAADPSPLLAEHGWTHVAMTVTAGTAGKPGSVELYRDGKLVDASSRYGEHRIPEIPGPLVIGSKTQSHAAFAFHGFMDDVLIYDRRLSEDEIRKLFVDSRKSDQTEPTPSPPTPPTPPTAPPAPPVAAGTDDLGGLIGHWPLDRISEASVVSVIGNFPGKLQGPKDSMKLVSPGQVGEGAIELKHPGYIELGQVMPAAAYTKAAWVRMAPGVLQYILAGKNHALWAPRQQGTYRLQTGHNGTFASIKDRSPIEVGKWYHVAVTYDPEVNGGKMVLYRDGREVGQATSIPPIDQDRALHIGGRSGRGAFMGRIDDVRLFNRALTAEQIRSVFQGKPLSADPPTTPKTTPDPPKPPPTPAPKSPAPAAVVPAGPVRLYVNAGNTNVTAGGREWVKSSSYKAGGYGHVGRLQLDAALDARNPLLSSRAWA
ncbi:MAG: hypothetical protein OER86_11230, partial [Phycisphaerae bacterium]|nr:hypothetical protein [Phycisphaerae bacterium]